MVLVWSLRCVPTVRTYILIVLLLGAVCSNNSRHGPNPPRHRLPVYSNYFYRDQYDQYV